MVFLLSILIPTLKPPENKSTNVFIFLGKYLDGDMQEGRNIFVDEKGEKKKAYYFTKSENKESSGKAIIQ